MKRYLTILLAFMLSLFVVNGQSENVQRTIGSNDSLTVSVKFEKVKLTKEESTVQAQTNALISNSMVTTGQLSRTIDRLATTLEDNIKKSNVKKIDIIAEQVGITSEQIKQSYKRNSTIKLIALIPTLLVAFWAMGQFLFQKGLDIKQAIQGTAIVTLYGAIASVVLYIVLSLIFNSQYFLVKDLMSAIF